MSKDELAAIMKIVIQLIIRTEVISNHLLNSY
jgi:hypothetical protein